MLKLLRRWLGWDAAPNPFGLGGTEVKARPASATRELLLKKTTPKPPAPRSQAKAAEPKSRPPTAAKQGSPQGAPRAGKPSLSLDKPADDRFDPYNTGAFNRSASWERISRSGR